MLAVLAGPAWLLLSEVQIYYILVDKRWWRVWIKTHCGVWGGLEAHWALCQEGGSVPECTAAFRPGGLGLPAGFLQGCADAQSMGRRSWSTWLSENDIHFKIKIPPLVDTCQYAIKCIRNMVYDSERSRISWMIRFLVHIVFFRMQNFFKICFYFKFFYLSFLNHNLVELFF